ncbi:uncharacterized protein A1O9_01429 [Exophiala aquamarina CBS 119918]|uniref:PQ loop repeat protein n=1 Tax=Exophiala aquamarina CBS 119918 TaxID=1182545 RepID=A0A072PUB8_9EURO|nr:uncharacterized protein A1O9_01429 [Exophiala aquamarina CBS 119918]KEF63451.1 hypothetical protein A1O9_01429 [Exophiala aquamarina CBS 119918]
MDVPVAANILGVTGAICWSVQLIPQIVINYRRHDTTGLQPTMMLFWAAAGIPLGVYNIVEDFNVALRIQPQLLTFLSLVTWIQCKYYGDQWPLSKSAAILTPVVLLMGGIECGLIFALRKARREMVEWPTVFMAVLSACLLSAGVLRHYWDIYKERTVRGISFLFVFIDALGDLTSLTSVIFQRELDILGMVMYGSELILWLGVFACGGYCKEASMLSPDAHGYSLTRFPLVNLRPWVRRRLEQRQSVAEDRELSNSAGNGEPRAPEDNRRGLSSSSSTTVFRTASLSSSQAEHVPNSMRLRAVTVDPSV